VRKTTSRSVSGEVSLFEQIGSGQVQLGGRGIVLTELFDEVGQKAHSLSGSVLDFLRGGRVCGRGHRNDEGVGEAASNGAAVG
jgi:hypothetical protein